MELSKPLAFKIILMLCFSLLVVGCQQPQQKPNLPEKPKQQETANKEEPTITVFMHETGEKKEMKLEEYLLGVVAAEMEPNWPIEALAAQAILARTFTMEKISKGGVKERGTDASTNIEEFQAYDAKRINENVKKAVDRTRGEVAKYKDKYIKAWFFADGGGVTSASADEGLGFKKEPTPYIKSVKDPGFEITKPENKAWKAAFGLDKVKAAVKKTAGKDPGQITNVQVVEKGPSGRATKIKVGNTIVSAPALRLALGSTELKSTFITEIAVTGGQVVFTGKGYGHGVGMSQWGANALAEQGKKAEDIVKYFFKNVEIVKEWN